MNLLYTLYIISGYLFILYFLWVSNRKTIQASELHREYASKLIAYVLGSQESPEQSLQATSRQQRNALIQTIHNLISHTYDSQRDAIRLIVKQNQLQKHIVKQLTYSTALHKCRLLWQLTSIIYDDKCVISTLTKYLNSSNHNIRTHALIAILSAKPSELISIISSLQFRLKPSDILRIISLIRQGSLFVVIEPLFESDNHNLKMLALAIVSNFGIDIADKYIYHIINNEQDPTIVEEAIYTLTTLKRPLKYRAIKKCLASASEYQRMKLCRHLSVEGYSLNSIKAILNPAECQYAQQLITSYKRQIVQTQSV